MVCGTVWASLAEATGSVRLSLLRRKWEPEWRMNVKLPLLLVLLLVWETRALSESSNSYRYFLHDSSWPAELEIRWAWLTWLKHSMRSVDHPAENCGAIAISWRSVMNSNRSWVNIWTKVFFNFAAYYCWQPWTQTVRYILHPLYDYRMMSIIYLSFSLVFSTRYLEPSQASVGESFLLHGEAIDPFPW